MGSQDCAHKIEKSITSITIKTRMKFTKNFFFVAAFATSVKAFLGPQLSNKWVHGPAFAPPMTSPPVPASTTARGFMSQLLSVFGPGKMAEKISKAEMKELLYTFEKVGRKKSELVVMDVRSPAEVSETGALSLGAITFPFNLIQGGAFELDPATFKKKFSFDKPMPNETLVFTCKSGMRAGMAADLASKVGYEKVIVYPGGAMEWFGC